MENFSYEAINPSGRMITGEMKAEYETVVHTRLRQMGYTVLEINEAKPSPLSKIYRFPRKVKLGDLAIFSRQLASMLDAGIPLTRILFTLSQQAEKPTLGDALADVARNVEEGAQFSTALESRPEIFSNLYVNMVRSGEVSGDLNQVLHRLADQLEKSKILNDQIRAATIYPVVVMVFALLIMLVMMIFIVPVFISFFPAEMKLPFITAAILTLSESIRFYWYLWILGIAGLYQGIKMYFRSPGGGRLWDGVKFKLPVFGSLSQKVMVASFARTLSTLLGGGIPVLQALSTTGAALDNSRVDDAIKKAGENIQTGENIAIPLKTSGLFPPMVIEMIAVGEETGSLPFLLSRVAEFYEAEVEAMTKALTSLIEPLLIIVLGVMVGIIMVALYLPIFTVITTL